MSNRQALIVILAVAALHNANAFVPPSIPRCSPRTTSCAATSAVEDRVETPEAEAAAAVEGTKLIMDIPPKPAAGAEIEDMKPIMDVPPEQAAAAEEPKPPVAEKTPKKNYPLPNFFSCYVPKEAAAAVEETKPIMDTPPKPAAEKPKPAAVEKPKPVAVAEKSKPAATEKPKPVAVAEKPKPAAAEKPKPVVAAEKTKLAAAAKKPKRSVSPWPKPAVAKQAPAKKAGSHKEGVFSPIVYGAGAVLGEGQLKVVRARVISVHSDLIKSLVGTSDSAFGKATLKQLFNLADTDNSGYLDREELAVALDLLGFKWLDSKQVDKIFKKADTNGDKEISLEEFMEEAPKTLKMNLIKLAKANGTDMGLMV